MVKKFDLSQLPKEPTLEFEQALWDKGLTHVAGIDEAGRGPLAGPVAAAVVILRAQPEVKQQLKGVRDSKQMTAAQRSYWAGEIQKCALAWGVGMASSMEIDAIGILPATRLAVERALKTIPFQPEHILVDYLVLPGVHSPQTPLVKGDARSLSIAAASVLAKTTRDKLLCELDSLYPGYGFAQHKGYGTREHLAAIHRLGYSPIHRRTFHLKCDEEKEE